MNGKEHQAQGKRIGEEELMSLARAMHRCTGHDLEMLREDIEQKLRRNDTL